MPTSTPNLSLYKYDTSTDGEMTFNFKNSLNDNWDKVDTAFKGLSDNKADTSAVNSALALKADTSAVNSALALKADKTSLHALKSYSDKGELLTDPEGLADVITYAHSTFDLSKFTVVGSPNITDDGIASDFTTSNYLTTSGFTLSDLQGKSWTFEGGAYYKVGVLQYAFIRFSETWEAWGSVLFSDNSISLKLKTGTTEDSSTEGPKITISNPFTEDTYCKVMVEYNHDTGVYTLRVGKLGERYTKSGTWTATTTNTELYTINNNPTQTFKLGLMSSNNVFNGSIDLKYCTLTANGIPIFSGNKTGIDTIKPDNYTVVGTPTISDDGIASGFSNSNYLTHSITINNNSILKIDISFAYSTLTSQAQRALTFGTSRLRIMEEGDAAVSVWIAEATSLSYATKEQLGNPVAGDTIRVIVELNSTESRVVIYVNGIKKYTNTKTEQSFSLASSNIYIGSAMSSDYWRGSIDLNSVKIYADDNLVCQPCLKIPYTLSKTGSKVVNSVYRDRVNDMAEQFGYANYYTLSDTDFTLPQGEVYGMIGRLQKLVDDEIGLPKATLSNTLNDNEIWLEGAEVSKLTYSKLYAIYGDDYGTPTDSANFVLPDFRDRVMQGIGSGGTFGYISAGLPNITGSVDEMCTYSSSAPTGAIYETSSVTWKKAGTDQTLWHKDVHFDASRSSSIYGNSTTVQPPAIKVRFKTRFQ